MIIGTTKVILSSAVSRIRKDMRDPVLRRGYIGAAVGMAVSIPCGPIAMLVFPVVGTLIGTVSASE